MQKTYCNTYIYGLLLALLLTGTSVAVDAQKTEQSVDGTYIYKTYKNGEGYNNSLDVEDRKDGKLHVFLSGSYNYTNNGSESMHEAEGEGDARLRGTTAIANLRDEAGKNCRATITFRANQANVKISAACQFNIILSGSYKKKRAKSQTAPAANRPTAAKSTEISFENTDDVLNDYKKHRAGERLIITNVPVGVIEKIERDDSTYKGLYILSSNEGGGVTKEFLASPALIKNLKTKTEFEPISLRVTAVVTQTDGGFDVYRMSFATKIEGLDENGAVIWTATGTEPAKVKFRG